MRLIICWICFLLAACAHQEPIAALQTQAGTIALQRVNGDGSFVVSVSPHTMLQLSGYTNAHIESTWAATSGQLIVIAGAGPNCPLRYTLVVVTAGSVSAVPIGECGETYSFVQQDGTFAIRQSNARGAKFWIFRDGSLYGPMIERARVVRPTRRAERSPPAESAADPTLLPPISTPVGDEVLPPPVAGANSPGPRSHDTPHF